MKCIIILHISALCCPQCSNSLSERGVSVCVQRFLLLHGIFVIVVFVSFTGVCGSLTATMIFILVFSLQIQVSVESSSLSTTTFEITSATTAATTSGSTIISVLDNSTSNNSLNITTSELVDTATAATINSTTVDITATGKITADTDSDNSTTSGSEGFFTVGYNTGITAEDDYSSLSAQTLNRSSDSIFIILPRSDITDSPARASK